MLPQEGVGDRERPYWAGGKHVTAHIYINGEEFELPDVTHVTLAHTEATGGSLVTLRKQPNQLLGYLHVGPGCFVTVGDPPKKETPVFTELKLRSPSAEPG